MWRVCAVQWAPGLRKTSQTVCMDCVATPLFGLRHPSIGTYRLLGKDQVLVRKWWPAGGSHPWIPEELHHQCLCPTVSHNHPSAWNPPVLASGSNPGSYGVTAFPRSWWSQDSVCHYWEWSFCCPSIVEFLQSNPLAFIARCSGGSAPNSRPPGWGGLGTGLRTHSCGRALWYRYFSFVGPYLACMGFDFYHLVLIYCLLYDFLFVFWI